MMKRAQVFLNGSKMYLEISGRGSGKTYRLIQTAKIYVAEDERNIANIVYPTTVQAKRTKELIDHNYKNDPLIKQFHYTSFERKNPVVRGYTNVRNFIDEFDYIKFKINNSFFFGDAFKDDYYTTSPAKIRDLSEIPIEEAAKKDFLLRLLLENHGMYVGFVYGQYFITPHFLRTMKESMDTETFEREIEGKFIKY
jgi:hypothetical protein